VPPLAARLDRGHERVRPHAPGDEHLRAVDDETTVNTLGAGAYGRDVRARIGLGDRQRRDRLAPEAGYEIALLLVLGPELPDRRQRDPDVGADAGGEAARATAGELFGEHRVGDDVASASVLGRELQPEIADLGHPLEHVVGEPPRVFPLGGMRVELALDEPPDRRAELLVLSSERRDG
jgi:hypothetical protein